MWSTWTRQFADSNAEREKKELRCPHVINLNEKID